MTHNDNLNRMYYISVSFLNRLIVDIGLRQSNFAFITDPTIKKKLKRTPLTKYSDKSVIENWKSTTSVISRFHKQPAETFRECHNYESISGVWNRRRLAQPCRRPLNYSFINFRSCPRQEIGEPRPSSSGGGGNGIASSPSPGLLRPHGWHSAGPAVNVFIIISAVSPFRDGEPYFKAIIFAAVDGPARGVETGTSVLLIGARRAPSTVAPRAIIDL